MLSTEWQTSDDSGGGNDCVEVRRSERGDVEVRNSKRPDAGTVIFTPSEWRAFLPGVVRGQFDLPA